jgi:molybdate transport system substrate-binding protein
MSTKVLNIVRGAGVAVSVLALSSLSAQAQTIYVGVAANFAAPLTALATDFLSKTGITISQTSASTGVLKGQILPNCHASPYDLFLAAEQQAAADVEAATSGGTDCSLHYPSGNSPFLYSTGETVLWSSTANGANISAGLPNPLTANVVIAAPNTAPYGEASMQVINAVLSPSPPLTTTSSYPVTIGSYTVNTAINIDATYNAIAAGTYKYGFVAKSRVATCSGGSATYSANTFSHHEYPWNVSPTHNQLAQYGVGITRTGGATAAVQTFIDYLLTDPDARAIIADFCYT